jgi:hypothetical protein
MITVAPAQRAIERAAFAYRQADGKIRVDWGLR